MKTSRGWLLLMLIVVMALVLASCGSEPTEVAESDDEFMLSLPRVTIDVDDEGMPSLAGISPETVKTMTLGALDLTNYALPQDMVDWFKEADVQHIELVHGKDGLYVFVNAKAMPSVGWDGSSLQSAGDAAVNFGVLDPTTGKVVKLLIPFLQRTGVDAAMRFPVGDGASEIAMRDTSVPVSRSVSDSVNKVMQFRAHVNYNEEGVPSVMSVSTQDLQDALGYDLRTLNLTPEMIAQLQAADVQHMTVRTTPQGVLVYLNQDALPYLAWGEDELINTSDLYGQLYFSDNYAPARTAMSMLLPMLDNVDAEVALVFPREEGEDAIPLPSN